MNKPISLLRRLAYLVLAALSPTAWAADLGDAAPQLQISEWIKGQAVDLAAGKGKKIHVVEFWATWCGPCRTSIPHLTELQKKFKAKDVVFVGVSDEKADVVKKFADQMGEKMDYAVALDRDDKTTTGYMRAFGVNTIPHAFVVDKEGRFVWHGHPMNRLDEILQELVDGKLDLAVIKKRERGEQMLKEFQQLAASGKDDAKADQLAKELEALSKEIEILPGKKLDLSEIRKQARFSNLMNAYARAVFEDQEKAKIEELAKQAEAAAPSDVNFTQARQELGLRVHATKYFRLLTSGSGEEDAKVADLAKQIAAAECKDAELLNSLAWTMLTDKRIKKRDLNLASKLAKAAYDACEGKDSAIVDTYARALFDTGKKAEAIRFQKQAIELCTDTEAREQLEATLKEYQEQADQ
jgi:thiol-disulfide isomerase/thioredoxin